MKTIFLATYGLLVAAKVMEAQQVGADFWSMVANYGALAALGGLGWVLKTSFERLMGRMDQFDERQQQQATQIARLIVLEERMAKRSGRE